MLFSRVDVLVVSWVWGLGGRRGTLWVKPEGLPGQVEPKLSPTRWINKNGGVRMEGPAGARAGGQERLADFMRFEGGRKGPEDGAGDVKAVWAAVGGGCVESPRGLQPGIGV